MIYIINIAENFETRRSQRNVSLYKELVEGGENVKLISGNFEHGQKKYIKNRNPDQILIPLLPYGSHFSISRFINHIWFSVCVFFICLFSMKLKAVLVSSIPSELLLSISILGRIRRSVVTVVDVRDIWPDSLPHFVRKSYFGLLFVSYCNLMNKIAFRLIKRISIVNPHFHPFVKRFNRSAFLIPLGYDSSRFTNLPEYTRNGCVYIGNLNISFDLELLIGFINSHNDLVVIGDGPLGDKYREIFPGADFLGHIPYEDVGSKLCYHEYGLLPISGSATLPNKVFDYVATGLTIVTNSESCASLWSNGQYEALSESIFIVKPCMFPEGLLVDYSQVSKDLARLLDD